MDAKGKECIKWVVDSLQNIQQLPCSVPLLSLKGWNEIQCFSDPWVRGDWSEQFLMFEQNPLDELTSVTEGYERAADQTFPFHLDYLNSYPPGSKTTCLKTRRVVKNWMHFWESPVCSDRRTFQDTAHYESRKMRQEESDKAPKKCQCTSTSVFASKGCLVMQKSRFCSVLIVFSSPNKPAPGISPTGHSPSVHFMRSVQARPAIPK